MKLLKILLTCIALANLVSASADCTSFPVDIFINEIDPRFNLSYEDAAQGLQNGVDYVNQNIGRPVVRIGSNGVPVTFEWNDVSAIVATARQNDEVLKKMQLQIDELKSRVAKMTADHDSADAINALVEQINKQVVNYNAAVAAQNNLRAQVSNDVLGLFSRVSTYASIKIFGYESFPNLVHVAMHELGHMLGLGHSAGNVMDARTNQSFELSAADASRIRAEYDAVCGS